VCRVFWTCQRSGSKSSLSVGLELGKSNVGLMEGEGRRSTPHHTNRYLPISSTRDTAVEPRTITSLSSDSGFLRDEFVCPTRLAVRYPEVPVVFAGSRKFAEEWAYRFLGAAVADHTESS
jgi:hypothetical protein